MVRIDLHTHTSPKSFCSTVSPDSMIKQAREVGLDGVCFTEHDEPWDEEAIERLRQKHGFLILRGMEVNTEYGHMLVFGVHRYLYGMHRAEFLREIVDAEGGAIVIAHPFRRPVYSGGGFGSLDTGVTIETAAQHAVFRMVEAVEVLNAGRPERENRFAAEFCDAVGLPKAGGSDAHALDEVGLAYTVFDQPITSEADLIRELKHGAYHPESRPRALDQ